MKDKIIYMALACLLVVAGKTYAAENVDIGSIIKNIDVAAVQEMIKEGIDVNARDDNGKTFLLYALLDVDNLAVAQYLIEQGADVNAPSRQTGVTPLIVATSTADKLQKQTIKYYETQNKVTDEEVEKLIVHQMAHALNMLKMLIEGGADINQETPIGTPLMNAATNEWNIDIVDMLLKAGADVNQKDRYGRTALFYASANNCNSIITKLLKAGADIEIKDIDGKNYMDITKDDFIKY